jgi:uncharacterized 2Fe-2S/4Fe-4S cluster protein (DUF4445 family)
MAESTPREYLVVFSPSGKRGHFPAGTPVLQAARALGVDIDSVCGGRAICGRCEVVVTEGNLPKLGIVSSATHLTPAGDDEHAFRERGGMADDRRLSCQAQIWGDVAIDVPASSQIHRQVVRKKFEVHDIKLNPVVHPYYVAVQ